MGADAMIIAVPVTLTKEQALEKMRKTKLVTLLAGLDSFDDRVSFDAYLYGEYFSTPTPDFVSVDEMVDAVNKFLTMELETFYGYLTDSREVTFQMISGKRYWLTGGMSSGDYPSEPYANFSLIYEMGLTDTEETE